MHAAPVQRKRGGFNRQYDVYLMHTWILLARRARILLCVRRGTLRQWQRRVRLRRLVRIRRRAARDAPCEHIHVVRCCGHELTMWHIYDILNFKCGATSI